MTYSIQEDIYEAVANSGLIDKNELAAKVAENVPSNQLRATVENLLPHHVLNMQRRFRGAVFTVSSGDGQRDLATSGRSARLRAMSVKDMVVHVPRGGREHEALRLGDCTVADLEALVGSYVQRAAENSAYAGKYRSLVVVMSSVGAVCVDDVSDTDLRKALA